MAKDDYYVIVGKILLFLYRKLKGREGRNTLEYLVPNSKDFPIRSEYFDYVIRHMHKDGMLENVALTAMPDGEPLTVYITEDTQITPKGIDYLQSNSRIAKVMEHIPEALEIVGQFV